MDQLLLLYQKLPPAARSVIATMRGYYLNAWRYGKDTDQWVAEAIEREQWAPERLKSWQEERLAYILDRAATQVPYYREMWRRRRQRGYRASWEYLENWPILEKEPLRENPGAFVADDCNVRRMFKEHTSGTTGKAITLWLSRQTIRSWYAYNEARNRSWYGVSRYVRWAILGGQVVTPFAQRRPPFWVWNAGLRQLYMSSYHLAPDLIPYYLDALVEYRVKYLLGYPSALYELALEALKLKRRDLNMTVTVTNAEPIYDYQRATISKAFGCPVRETYGMCELVAAASECNAGSLHQWPEVGVMEVLQGLTPIPSGGTGDFVCTGLMNPDMPLIRYRIGDRGSLSTDEAACGCGRSLPQLGSIEGRLDEVLLTADGRRIGRLDPVFKGQLPIREAQIIQEDLHHIRVKYVATPGFTKQSARLLMESLQSRLGNVEVTLESVDMIPRTKNGKFRAVISMLPTSQSLDASRYSVKGAK
jgi:phenylacetate-CoA ligase